MPYDIISLRRNIIQIGEDMFFRRKKNKINHDSISSRISNEDYRVLEILAESVARQKMQILEIGSFLGNGSTRALANMLKQFDGRLYCVDTWKGSDNVQWHKDLANQINLYNTFVENVAGYDGQATVRPMVMPSQDAVEICKDASFDLVFIDGDHSFSATSTDIASWLPKVRPGGILCGHDCEGRLDDFPDDTICAAAEKDFLPMEQFRFRVVHPGVVLAVEKAFHGSARIWAETDLSEHGLQGRSTIWSFQVPTSGAAG